MKNRPWSPRHGTKNTVKIKEKVCFSHGRHIMEPRIQGKYMKKSPMVTTSWYQEYSEKKRKSLFRQWSPHHGSKNTGEIHEKMAHGHHVLELRLQGKYMKKSPMVTMAENQESLSK